MSVYDWSFEDGMAALARTEQQLEERHYQDELDAADHRARIAEYADTAIFDLGDLADGLTQAVHAIDLADITRLAREIGVLQA